MIGIAFVFTGWFIGRLIYGYVHRFAFRLSQEIHAAYIEIYPKNPPHFAPEKSILTPMKSKISQPYYCLFFALLFALCDWLNEDIFTAICWACFCSLLFAISVVDGYYRLISPALCQNLFALGLGAAYWQITPLTVEQSLQSAVIFFGVFSLIYYGAKGYYKQEAFGRGDCWLALGLGTFFSYEQLPAFLLLACLSGLVYALYGKLSKRHLTTIPFGPFLSLSGVLCRLLN